MLLALLCMATCQQSEHDRVYPVVERLMGPRTDRGLPMQFVGQRALMAEQKIEAPVKIVHVDDEELEDERPAVIDALMLSRECFDNWVFGNVQEMQREWIDCRLRERLMTQATRYHLTEAEIAKLHLAGRGDIKRLFTEIEAKRKAYREARGDIARGRDILRGTFGVSRRFEHGPFYEDSIFDKALTKILDDRKAR